mmetsp:Transcript_130123/g.404761  ORF Transcript_130123/g.404761 Transcript_130123/m.404761 type:complete len:113 (-) Transcript_130123:130-468(-)
MGRFRRLAPARGEGGVIDLSGETEAVGVGAAGVQRGAATPEEGQWASEGDQARGGRKRRPSELEEAIYELVRTVPAGRVTTYGAVAAALGRGCPRNVGAAMRGNPYGCEAMP